MSNLNNIPNNDEDNYNDLREYLNRDNEIDVEVYDPRDEEFDPSEYVPSDEGDGRGNDYLYAEFETPEFDG